MTRNTQHVVTNLDGVWKVKRGGATRASRVFIEQKDAISYARKLSRKQNAVLLIHGEDGAIKKSKSYGKAEKQSKLSS